MLIHDNGAVFHPGKVLRDATHNRLMADSQRQIFK